MSGQPEVGGLIPSSTMAEEILTPGDGSNAGHDPADDEPAAQRGQFRPTEAAFAGLDFIVAVDFYINETTRFANIILPTPSAAEQENYEFGLYHLSVRNVAKWSWAAVPPPAGAKPAWEVLLRLGAIFTGAHGLSTKDIDDLVFRQVAAGAVKEGGPWHGLTVEEIAAKCAESVGPERVD